MKNRPESILKSLEPSSELFQRSISMLASLSTSPHSGGRELLKKYLSGEVLGNAPAIKAKCCECSGNYVDGKKDCEVYTCPLYPYMPYGKMRKPQYIRPERRKNEI